MNTIASVVIGILGAVDLVTLIIFFINRHDQRKGLADKLTVLEKDGLRTQLLMLMLMKPDSKQEIMTIAQHYFSKKASGGLEGNWYMTSLFNHWLQENGDAKPEWFD